MQFTPINRLLNKRVLFSVLAMTIALLLVGLLLASATPPQSTAPARAGTVQFTNRITGQPQQDIIGDNNIVGPISIPVPHVTIDGIEPLYTTYLTSDQASNTQTIINNFLLAQAGLEPIMAAVQNNTLTKGADDRIHFRLVVTQPELTYDVTVQAVSQSQTIPYVSFKQVSQ